LNDLSRSSTAVVTSANAGWGFGKLVLFVIAATICRPLAIFP
jgi:hypothetical protein